MLFNSFNYLLFFPVVCVIYYLIPNKFRWVFLLLASYFFYMNWEPIYAILIFLSTFITYLCAFKLDKVKDIKVRKVLLIASIILNFGILFLFKYYNFLTDSLFNFLNYFNIRVRFPEFKLLLPVGISFYTFQAVGYSIDVYYNKLKHENNFGKYALFVSFFPQLVAGPIERATNLLPQFSKEIVFNYAKAIEGTKLIIWGYFMKVVVADRLSIYVDSVYNNINMHNSPTLIIATIFFAFQIYCDFGGYSNIAIGCAKILGFDLMTNFCRPYFAKNCPDFWHRWHISLSTWFKDYVYIPLGGNRVSKKQKYLNLIITFLVSGLWHGANWTFVIWGGLNGIFQVVYSIFKPFRIKLSNRFTNLIQIISTFILIDFTWIFFRANNSADAIKVIQNIFTKHGPLFFGDNKVFIYGFIGLIILIIKDIYDECSFTLTFENNKIIKYTWYATLTILILMIGVFDGGQFIYFQF
ncbi:MBOAT family O-acyltransferase [Plebeiibacterium sediminum]|uniref:MBOAT family protein n=1 Tax=Plebeiibacterium sediminum TaxID=2992112 RepID=A0AAE3M3Z4_9BACT|nr:MBOAT family O-acyltransferase [Plebeiobacterium sediminum]MCW3786638.1 MBOAT family protein [Plebeiobacterium sediminum]